MVFPEELILELDTLISGLIREQSSIGFTLGIRDQEQSLFTKSYGRLEINSPGEVNEESLFSIGSISKSFTVLSILILAEQGKLNIDDPISKYLPLKLNGREQQIKLRHLMSHSSGLPNIHLCVIIEKMTGIRPDYQALPISMDLKTWTDLFDYINEQGEFITTEPGERFHYSDTSFSLLQYVIQHVSGMTYHEFVKNHIFQPLEMNRATFRSKFFGDSNTTRGHLHSTQTTDGIQATPSNYPGSELVDGGGGVMASNNDMMNYLSMMMHKGTYNGNQLISEKSYELLITPCVDVMPEIGFSYAFGWFVIKSKDVTMIAHTGNTGASTSIIAFIPDKNLGILFMNNLNIPPMPIFRKIRDIVSHYNPNYSPSHIIERFEEYVGHYEGVGSLEALKILHEDEKIIFKFSKVTVNSVRSYSVPVVHNDFGYFVVLNGEDLRVIADIHNGRKMITIGFNKFKKVD